MIHVHPVQVNVLMRYVPLYVHIVDKHFVNHFGKERTGFEETSPYIPPQTFHIPMRQPSLNNGGETDAWHLAPCIFA